MKRPNDTKRPNTNSGSMGQLMRSRERMIHVSAPIGYMPNPDFKPELEVGPFNQPEIPFIQKIGKMGIRDLGRNAAKRKLREANRTLRAATQKRVCAEDRLAALLEAA